MRLKTFLWLVALSTAVFLFGVVPTARPVAAAPFVAREIDLGPTHTCVVTNVGGVKCWGANDNGQLGDGSTSEQHAPVDVVGLSSGVAHVALGDSHTCAQLFNGDVRCWGKNANGQLGDNTTNEQHVPFSGVALPAAALNIAAGGSHSCAYLLNGSLWCWGTNNAGELGDTTKNESHVPVQAFGVFVPPLGFLAAGSNHSCAATMKCWGSNSSGKLGLGFFAIGDQPTPDDVVGLGSLVISMTAGPSHTCAVLEGPSITDGGAFCWGDNSAGQLGNNTRLRHSSMVDVVGLTSGVQQIAAGDLHTCALTTAGAAKCWGDNSSGQLGDGTNQPHVSPVDVAGLNSGLLRIAAGGSHTCAITGSGAVLCWGANNRGQLGNGSTAASPFPVSIQGFPVAPTLSKSFGAATLVINTSTSLTFNIANPNATALSALAFTDNLPAGLIIATPNGLSGACGGVVTAAAGSGSITLTGGAVVASGNCSFSVNVSAVAVGSQPNTTGSLTSNEAPPGAPATALLTVTAGVVPPSSTPVPTPVPPSGPSTSLPPTISKAFNFQPGKPSFLVVGTVFQLSFTIANPNAASTLTGVGFSDSLPAGLILASPVGLNGGCGGGTITAAGGTGILSLTGATLAPSAVCTFTVNLVATSSGFKSNTSSAVTSFEGGLGNAATASITVS